MKQQFPWYDSSWLATFVEARELVQLNYPDRLAEFDSAFEILKTSPEFNPQKLDSVLSQSRLEQLKNLIQHLDTAKLEKQELLTFGRFVVHDHPLFDEIQSELTETASSLAGEPLEASYNFLSLYNNLGHCPPHMDAPNAKWTLDICLDQSDIWPIYFSKIQPWPLENKVWGADWGHEILHNSENAFQAYELSPGEAVLFSGSSQWHYRSRIAQKQSHNYCHLLFLHFIPKGTKQLVNPANWAQLFAMPALEGLNDIGGEIDYRFSVSC